MLDEIDAMPYAEFMQWRIYEQIEPFGDRRADLQAGILASTVYNMFRGKDSPSKAASDFMIKWDEVGQEAKQQTPADHKRIFTLIRDAQNAVVAARAGQLSSFG